MECLEYICPQCNKVFNGPVPYLSHMKSERHRHKASYVDEPNAVARRTVAAYIESAASGAASGPPQALMRKPKLHSICDLCKVSLNSETAAEIHNKGKKHLQKMKNQEYRRLIMGGVEREATVTSSSPGLGAVQGASPSCAEHWCLFGAPASSTPLTTPQGAESTSSDWNPSALAVTSSILGTKRGPETTAALDCMPSTQQQDVDLPKQHCGQDLSCEPCGIVLFKNLEYKLEHINTTAHQLKESQAAGCQTSQSDWGLIEGLAISEYQRQKTPGISSCGWSPVGKEKGEGW